MEYDSGSNRASNFKIGRAALERAVKPVLVGEKRVNAVSVTKNYFCDLKIIFRNTHLQGQA